MIFTSYWFLIFFLVFIVLFYSSSSEKIRSLILATASFIFYWHFCGPAGILPILLLGAITFFIGISGKNKILNYGIALSILCLLYYKYTNFILDNLFGLFPILKSFPVYEHANIIAPLAISFFAFEFIHYLYDLKTGHEVIRNPLSFFHFAMFFPTLAAGPIKRFEEFMPSLAGALAQKSKNVYWVNLQSGFFRMCIGFGKKLVADSLSAYVGFTCTQANFMTCPISQRWVIFSAIAMRIYLDFSGYSDMAIGAAKMIGIKIPENFNWPYVARSLSDFWRRWHISLSSWIRDYLYIPLGGNRVGPFRHIFNLIIVFFICGLWHGASWNFIAWGLFHGAGLAIESSFGAVFSKMNFSKHNTKFILLSSPVLKFIKIPIIFSQILLTNLFVWAGWLLFFYPPGLALDMFKSLFGY